MSILKELVFWHWLIIAMVLFILEVFAPGAFFIWMAVAATVVGLLMWLFGLAWPAQYVIFSVLSIASIVAWKAWKKRHPDVEEYPALNRRGQQLVGRRFTLSDPIVNEVGKVRVDDSTWKVRGPDLPAGTTVTVTAVDGTVLIVAAAE